MHWKDVLKYRPTRRSQSTIRRYYEKWRMEQGLLLCCDNAKCKFHKAPLVWNGEPLNLILDHVDGNRYNNSPNNLRYLCPNCDSQLPTRGGANRGRVTNLSVGGYTLHNKDGTQIIAATGMSTGRSTARAYSRKRVKHHSGKKSSNIRVEATR